MQTSAETKAKEFIKSLEKELHFDAKEHLPFGMLQDRILKLLLEHERDTRYTAIDIIRSVESEIGVDGINDVVNQEDVIQLVHNLKVGN